MAEVLPKPKVFYNDQNIQLNYELLHRIHEGVWYPLPSQNGSTILLYGHENGVRVIWRGGRPFKQSAGHEDKSKTNGGQEDILMIIDSDEEGAETQFVDNPEFEDAEEEQDPTKPYPQIIQYLDLSFGVAVTHVAVPPSSMMASDPALGHGPALLKDRLVFAATCSDFKIRVITMPLTPPSPASKARRDLKSDVKAGDAGQGKWGETVNELAGGWLPLDSISILDGVSMTFSAEKDAPSATGEEVAADSGVHVRSKGVEWHLLVASHSREGAGLLLIHRIPVTSERKGGKMVQALSKDQNIVSQKVSLSLPITKISFNPCNASTAQASHLLVAHTSGACRVYDCEASPTATQFGSWLLTMYTGFQKSKADSTPSSSAALPYLGRKPIVDAEWVMGGKAIMVLLADGEWGIWDVEGSGASGNTRAILGRQAVRGGALTAFSISGWVESTPMKLIPSKSASSQAPSSKFTPMTPSTRKTAEPVLFSGRGSVEFPCGQISVARLPTASPTSLLGESVVLWFEDAYYLVPNLRVHWEAQSRRGGSNVGSSSGIFSSSPSAGRLIRLEGINLRGERCCGIAQHPREFPSKFSLPTEILIAGEHRFLIVSDRAKESKGQRHSAVPNENEYPVLAPRDLDVMEIDQVLEDMEQSNGNSFSKQKRISGFSK